MHGRPSSVPIEDSLIQTKRDSLISPDNDDDSDVVHPWASAETADHAGEFNIDSSLQFAKEAGNYRMHQSYA